jgi:RHS repeat-associated protein
MIYRNKAVRLFYKIVSGIVLSTFLISPFSVAFADTAPATQSPDTSSSDVSAPVVPATDTSDTTSSTTTTATPSTPSATDTSTVTTTTPPTFSSDTALTTTLAQHEKDVNTALTSITPTGGTTPDVMHPAMLAGAAPSQQTDAPQLSLNSQGKLNAQVNGNTGALGYSYPLTLPPGRNGMTPDLSLQYNSQNTASDSVIGYGWNVSIPYISRENKHGVDQLYTGTYNDYTTSDKGELGQISGNNYQLRSDDGSFTKYVYSSTTGWTVTTKTGLTYTYGAVAASRQDDPGNSADVYKWMLDSVTDANGNSISYTYFKDQGQIYPSVVTYTNAGGVSGPFTVTFGRETATNSIPNGYLTGFSVTTKYRINTITIAIATVTRHTYALAYTLSDNATKSLLSSITETGNDAQGGYKTLAPEKFTYTNSGSKTFTQQTSWALPSHTLTGGTKQDARLGMSGDNSGVWPNAKNGVLIDINGDGIPDWIETEDPGYQHDTSTTFANTNGKFYDVYLGNAGGGYTYSSSWTAALPLDSSGNQYELDNQSSGTGGYNQLIDVNGDGLPDFVITTPGSTLNTNTDTVWLNTGTGWTKSTTWTMPTMTVSGTTYGIALGYSSTGGVSGYTYDTQLIDINNDGLPDIVQTTNDNFGSVMTSDHYSVWLNTGTGWSKSTTWAMPVHPTGTGTYYGSAVTGQGTDIIEDINGDGLPDWVETTYSSTSNETYDVWLNTGTSWVRSTSWTLPVHTGYTLPPYTTTEAGVQLGFSQILCNVGIGNSYQCGTRSDALIDVNGDGLPDFVETTDYLNEFDVIWLNNGNNGWVKTTSWQMPMLENNSGHDANEPMRIGDNGTFSTQIADINNDGLPDFVASCDCGTTGSSSNPQTPMIFINTGSGWATSSWGQPTRTNEGNYNGSILGYTYFNDGTDPAQYRTVVLQDVNGDGSPDWIESNQFQSPSTSSTPYERYAIWSNSATQSDLLTSITNPQGASSTYTYAPQTIVDKNATTQTQTIEAVTSVTVNDGIGSTPMVTSYAYANGKFFYSTNQTWRKFAGFQTITTTNPDGSKTINYYHQGNGVDSTTYEYADNEYLIGKLYRTDITDSQGNLYKRTTTEWTTYPITSVNSNVSFVYPNQTITEYFDGYATEKATAETWAYNTATGNITGDYNYGQVTATTPLAFTDTGTDKETTYYNFATNGTGMYLVCNQSVYDQSSNKVSEIGYYYDNQPSGVLTLGNETKRYYWKTGSTYIYTEKSYNTNGTIATTTDGRGYVTTNTTYDTYSLYPITVTDPLSHVTHYTYDYMFGLPIQTTDVNGQIYIKNYDGLGRLLLQQIPDPATGTTVNRMTVGYGDYSSGTQNVEKFITTMSGTAYYVEDYYDGLGRLVEEKRQTDPNGTSTNYQTTDYWYGANGKISKQSLPYNDYGGSYDRGAGSSALNTTYNYDTMQRVSYIYNNLGTTSNVYKNWKVTTTDPNTNVKNYYYDAYNNLVQVDEINSGTTYSTYYTWNLNKNLLNITDSLGNVRNFTYDGLGNRLTAQDLHASTDSTYGTWTYSYDNDNDLSQSVSPNAATVNYTYDNGDRLATVDWTGGTGTEATYAYDTCTQGVGRLCSVTMISGTGANTAYTYDYDGNIASEQKSILGSINYTTSYTHNLAGDIVTIVYPDNATVQYNYLSDGLVSSVNRKESGGSYTGVVTAVTYSPNLQLATITYANGDVTTNTYDPTKLYRLTNKQTQNSSSVNLQNDAYTYDTDGNLTNLVDSSATSTSKTVAYTYDNLNRLKTATATGVASGTSPYTQSFNYDGLGNITSGPTGTYLYQGNTGTLTANPDAATSVNGVTQTYDADGNLLTDGTHTNTWDYKDELTKSVVGGAATNMVYDDSGNRVRYTTPTLAVNTPNKYYTTENVGSGLFIKNIYLDNQLVAVAQTQTSTVTPLYIHVDPLNSVNIVTNASGTVTQTYDYYPYGAPRVSTGTFAALRQYLGQLYDSSDSLNYLNARFYNSSTSQFESEDPTTRDNPPTLLTDPQQLNFYSYGRDNPITVSDPGGRCLEDACIVEGVALYAAAPAIISGLEYAGTAIGGLFAAHDTGTVIGTAMSSAPSSYKNSVYNSVAGNWGAVMSGGQLSSDLEPAASTSSSLFDTSSLSSEAQRFLSKGDSTDVYIGSNEGKDSYIGISNNAERRAAEHGSRFDQVTKISTLPTTNQARAVEQAGIVMNPQYQNKINSISPQNSVYNEVVSWGKSILNSINQK